MLVSLWSPKGGVGTSVTAAVAAATLGRFHPDVRLVDMVGDQPAVCGLRVDDFVGVGDVLCGDALPPTGALDAITCDVGEAFRLVPFGRRDVGVPSVARGEWFGATMSASLSLFVVDVGTVTSDAAVEVLLRSDVVLLVARPCFLTLHRCTRRGELVGRSDGVVVIDEPHRSLRMRDVASIVGRPVVAELPCAAEIARTIDAGLLLRRAPYRLFAPMDRLWRQLGLASSREFAA